MSVPLLVTTANLHAQRVQSLLFGCWFGLSWRSSIPNSLVVSKGSRMHAWLDASHDHRKPHGNPFVRVIAFWMIHSNLQVAIDESGDSVLGTFNRYDATAVLLSDFVDVLQAMWVVIFLFVMLTPAQRWLFSESCAFQTFLDKYQGSCRDSCLQDEKQGKQVQAHAQGPIAGSIAWMHSSSSAASASRRPLSHCLDPATTRSCQGSQGHMPPKHLLFQSYFQPHVRCWEKGQNMQVYPCLWLVCLRFLRSSVR